VYNQHVEQANRWPFKKQQTAQRQVSFSSLRQRTTEESVLPYRTCEPGQTWVTDARTKSDPIPRKARGQLHGGTSLSFENHDLPREPRSFGLHILKTSRTRESHSQEERLSGLHIPIIASPSWSDRQDKPSRPLRKHYRDIGYKDRERETLWGPRLMVWGTSS
jgi:hypothetical protein